MNNLKKLKKDIDKWVITTSKHTYKTNDTSEQEEKTKTFIDKWATIISKSLARWKKKWKWRKNIEQLTSEPQLWSKCNMNTYKTHINLWTTRMRAKWEWIYMQVVITIHVFHATKFIIISAVDKECKRLMSIAWSNHCKR